jgi:hypothetical protein
LERLLEGRLHEEVKTKEEEKEFLRKFFGAASPASTKPPDLAIEPAGGSAV